MDIIEFKPQEGERSLQIINDTPSFRIEISVDRGYKLKQVPLDVERSLYGMVAAACPECGLAVENTSEVHFKVAVFSKEDGTRTLLRYHLACYDKSLRLMFDEVLNANKRYQVHPEEKTENGK